jgi:hypothetical protein
MINAPIPPISNETNSLERSQTGPFLAGLLSIALVGLCAVTYWNGEGSLDAVRLIDRLMIRIAVVFFSLTFAASELRAFFSGKITDWLFSNRRDLIISFVVAFMLHLCAIARFYTLDQHSFRSASPILSEVLRSVGLAFILLMLVDALIGGLTGRWKVLNAFGAYYLWGAFLNGFGKRISLDQFYVLPVALLVMVLILKMVGLMRRLPPGRDQSSAMPQ